MDSTLLWTFARKFSTYLKRYNRVYILSASEHTYRPMRAREVAQLFYKCVSKQLCIETTVNQDQQSDVASEEQHGKAESKGHRKELEISQEMPKRASLFDF